MAYRNKRICLETSSETSPLCLQKIIDRKLAAPRGMLQAPILPQRKNQFIDVFEVLLDKCGAFNVGELQINPTKLARLLLGLLEGVIFAEALITSISISGAVMTL